MPYIYLLRTRASVNINESVYKIGKTTDFNKRLSGYDKGSEPILILYVVNCDVFERVLIDNFTNLFTKRNDYGNEYFEGNVREMIQEIMIRFHELNMCYSNPILKQKEENNFNQCVVLSHSKQQELMCKMKNSFLKLLNKVNEKNINKFRNDISSIMCNNQQASNQYHMIYQALNSAGQMYGMQFFSLNKSVNNSVLKKFGDYLESKTNVIFELANYHVNSNEVDASRIYEMLKNIIL